MSEGGPYELVLVLIFYFSEEDGQKFQQGLLLLVFFCLYGVWWAILQAVQQARFTIVLSFSNEFMMITVLPFIYLYNGQRGGNGAQWQRDLFYYFYPAHLLILYILRYALVGVV